MAEKQARLNEITNELIKHISEGYDTLKKGSIGKNIAHDRDTIVKVLINSFPALGKSPYQANVDDLLAFGGIGTGTFIGKNSEKWNKSAAALAQKELNAGNDPVGIWQRHMTGRMPNGGLFQEIADNEAFLRDSGKYAGDIYSHPELFSHYPHLSRVEVTKRAGGGGSYNPKAWEMVIGDKNSRSTIAHEMQHAIQQREGWPMGGTIENFIDENNYYDSLPVAYDKYNRLAGEAQARATQDRLNMNMMQRRENYPLKGGMLSDVPINKLIYKYGGQIYD